MSNDTTTTASFVLDPTHPSLISTLSLHPGHHRDRLRHLRTQRRGAPIGAVVPQTRQTVIVSLGRNVTPARTRSASDETPGCSTMRHQRVQLMVSLTRIEFRSERRSAFHFATSMRFLKLNAKRPGGQRLETNEKNHDLNGMVSVRSIDKRLIAITLSPSSGRSKKSLRRCDSIINVGLGVGLYANVRIIGFRSFTWFTL